MDGAPYHRLVATASSGLRLRIAGFPVHVPLSMLLGVALIAYLWIPSFLGSGGSPVVSAVVFAVLLFGTVLLHELAHAVTARRFGFPVVSITLSALGGYTQYRPVRTTPGREAAIAAAGPVSTLALSGALWLFSLVADNSPGDPIAQVVSALIWATAFVGVFNLLPGLPLDGGALLAAGVWAATGSRGTGTIAAGWTGRLLALAMMASPFLVAAAGGRPPELSFVLVAFLLGGVLLLGANQALTRARADRSIAGATARDVAAPVDVVSAHAAVQDLDRLFPRVSVDGVVLAYITDAAGLNRVVGLVDPAAAAAVPQTDRSSARVLDVCRRLSDPVLVPAGASALSVAEALRETRRPAVVVDESGRPVGYIPAAG